MLLNFDVGLFVSFIEMSAMEPKDFIPLVSAVVVVAGWFVNSAINRRADLVSRRLDYRLDALTSMKAVLREMNSGLDPFSVEGFVARLTDALAKLEMHGTNSELIEAEKLWTALKSKDQKGFAEAWTRLNQTLTANFLETIGTGRPVHQAHKKDA